MALQNAESRGESFSKEDFLEGRVGARMVPEDFNFEVNVRFPLLTNYYTNSSSLLSRHRFYAISSSFFLLTFEVLLAERAIVEGTTGGF